MELQPLYGQSYQDIKKYINENLGIREKEKDKYAEVFTPTILIEDVLDNLPRNVWSNTELKWLDPCAGSGNFFLVVYHRLLNNITSIKDKQELHKHIVTKMLFMVELNTENTKKLQLLFGKEANIYNEDFLSWKNQEQYDIILGNPPYQSTKKVTYTGSAGNKTLWDKFLVKSLQILKQKGYLGFITPSNWRRPEHELYDLMTKENHLIYLHVYNKNKGKELFRVQTRFDVYIIQKTAPTKISIIVDENNEKYQDLNISEWPFLPNFEYNSIKQILVKPTEKGIDVLFDSSFYDARKLHKVKSINYKYPVIHTVNKTGFGLLYTNDNSKHFHTKKVILNFNEKLYPINDYLGKYGMSQLNFGIPIKSKQEGEQIIKSLTSPKFESIIRATKWSSFQTDYRMFKYFKPLFYQDNIFINKKTIKNTKNNSNKTRKQY